MTGVLSSFKYPRRGGDRSVGHAPAAVGRGLSLVKRFGAPGHLCLTKHDPTGARGRLTNQSGGLRGFVGSASAGKFKAVKSPHPAQSFLPLGVRPTVLRGPSTSVRRHNRTAFIRFHQKPQNELRRHSAYRSHPSVPLVLRHFFELDYETQAELHALLVKATKLAGGMP